MSHEISNRQRAPVTADILQIRDFQRPEERIACDKRLGCELTSLDVEKLRANAQYEIAGGLTVLAVSDNLPTVYLTEAEVDSIAKYADFRDDLTQAMADINITVCSGCLETRCHCPPKDYDPRRPA